MVQQEEPGKISLLRSNVGTLTVALSGRWNLRSPMPATDELLHSFDKQPPSAVEFDCSTLTEWDGSALAVITLIHTLCTARNIPIALDGLPNGASRLVTLATNAPSKKDTPPPEHHGAVERVGIRFFSIERNVLAVVAFMGELCIAFSRMVRGKSRVRGQDILLQAQLCGANALGIIVLVCFLVGVILAFVGAIELKSFGADVYVSDLVGVTMVREMGALMVGIVIAGRTGAAFAAELGTMKVNEELAALIGITTLGLQPNVYFAHTISAIRLHHVIGGLAKATTYGILIGIAGCMSGLRAGEGAASVGNAATSAVVDSLVLIIIACGIFAVSFYMVGI